MNFPKIQVPDRHVVLVIARTAKEFKDFCNDVEWEYNNIIPDGHDKHFGKEYIFAHTPRAIMGIRANEIIRIGTWRDRNDINKIEGLCWTRIIQ